MKAEEGELSALCELDEHTAAKLTPMLVFSSPGDTTKALIKENLDVYLDETLRETTGNWPFKHPVFVDLLCLDIVMSDGVNPIESSW
ncbi:MAG TPA: hypothetical protein VEC36_08425 [Patescibacteria group bacterium]|nr:hypothetical protein [Patescibacteria group bacterium]